MIPDQYLAANIARKTGVKVITHPGACEVHERFTANDIRQIRADYPDGVTINAIAIAPLALRGWRERRRQVAQSFAGDTLHEGNP